MTNTLMDVVKVPFANLHALLAGYVPESSPTDVLGEALHALRMAGTGRSLAGLALLDDLLRMLEIAVCGQWNPLDPWLAGFACPFFKCTALAFHRTGLNQYEPFLQMTSQDAGRFLECHATSRMPFGGSHRPTQWGGWQICANVALRFHDSEPVMRYEELARGFLLALAKQSHVARNSHARQLAEFVSDRSADLREEIGLSARQSSATLPPQATEDKHARLLALRAELERESAQLTERERHIEQEWRRYQQERARFEALRQEWEARREDHLPFQNHNAREKAADAAETFLARSIGDTSWDWDPPESAPIIQRSHPAAGQDEPFHEGAAHAEHVLFDEEEMEGSTNDFSSALADEGQAVLLDVAASNDGVGGTP